MRNPFVALSCLGVLLAGAPAFAQGNPSTPAGQPLTSAPAIGGNIGGNSSAGGNADIGGDSRIGGNTAVGGSFSGAPERTPGGPAPMFGAPPLPGAGVAPGLPPR